ncbi:MAG: hypothetical protein U0939_13680 [Pirellulales bacterium]
MAAHFKHSIKAQTPAVMLLGLLKRLTCADHRAASMQGCGTGSGSPEAG